MWVVVLAVPRYARHPVIYVMVNPGAGASSCPVGRGPDAQSVICMVDEVDLSFGSNLSVVRSNGGRAMAANTVLPSISENSARIVSHTMPA